MVNFEASKAKVFPLWKFFIFIYIHLFKKKKKKKKQSEIYQISDRAWRATQLFWGPHISDHAYTIDIEYNKSTRARILDIGLLIL